MTSLVFVNWGAIGIGIGAVLSGLGALLTGLAALRSARKEKLADAEAESVDPVHDGGPDSGGDVGSPGSKSTD